MRIKLQHAMPMADINVTPLIDVMLVLIIVFLLTAPILAHRIVIDLPQRGPPPPPPLVQPNQIRVLADGSLIFNGQALITPALEPQLRLEAAKQPQPGLTVDGALNSHYEDLALVLATAKTVGISTINFANLPQR